MSWERGIAGARRVNPLSPRPRACEEEPLGCLLSSHFLAVGLVCLQHHPLSPSCDAALPTHRLLWGCVWLLDPLAPCSAPEVGQASPCGVPVTDIMQRTHETVLSHQAELLLSPNPNLSQCLGQKPTLHRAALKKCSQQNVEQEPGGQARPPLHPFCCRARA